MKAHFLVEIELPDWANKPDRMECIRQEIEQHAGAAAAFYTRAAHVTASCSLQTGGEGAFPLSEYNPTGP